MTKRMALAWISGAVFCALFGTPSDLFAQTNMPDLIVDQAYLRQHWVVREETLPEDACSVIEGDVTPGTHMLLRFTVATPNIGDRDLFIGDPADHLADGLFEFATCHQHYHFKHYALYQLIDPQTGFIWRAAKRGFCMIDLVKYQQYDGKIDKYQFRACGGIGVPGNQGISKGWSDVYVWALAGQYFVLDGGDGQPEISPGDYILRITVNPPFVPGPGEVCPNLDPRGFCHTLPESDYQDNIAQITITIPDHKGRKAVGPLKDEPAVTQEIIDGP